MTTEILQQREDTGYAAGGDEGRTLCGLLASTVQRRGGEPAYSDRDDGGPWQTITWEQTRLAGARARRRADRPRPATG